ncbi:MAG TPA: GNAT family N-acetyltransferase [Flavitalea sp.]|nr:GNAT family N-acetyltransferase [Flavitalea sp.]
MNTMDIQRATVGKNIGQLLYKKALQIAREKKADYIWLGVWEQNQRAINFYTKNGFVPFGTHVFKPGDAEQTDIMMKLDVKDGAEN